MLLDVDQQQSPIQPLPSPGGLQDNERRGLREKKTIERGDALCDYIFLLLVDLEEKTLAVQFRQQGHHE
ncbi:conserved hypothetical protein [Ricinus communis]|uniref:Uncharacterized protein n=1 Tax=Ricinus communis TaxID=3988 RepID=B9T257_RICCO|nr:conserved hypothetical protein [Ricinus communis]